MDITKILSKASAEEFKEVLDAATPLERVWFQLARDGVQVYTSEEVPKFEGSEFFFTSYK